MIFLIPTTSTKIQFNILPRAKSIYERHGICQLDHLRDFEPYIKHTCCEESSCDFIKWVHGDWFKADISCSEMAKWQIHQWLLLCITSDSSEDYLGEAA